jgi:hypothetical protein
VHKHLKTWLKLGRANPWIRTALDPPFNEESFHICKDIDELEERLDHGNWCLGAAFVLGDLCFINQVNGGDEWLVIRGEVRFESLTSRYLIRDGQFRAWVEAVLAASEDQLRNLTYTPKGFYDRKHDDVVVRADSQDELRKLLRGE